MQPIEMIYVESRALVPIDVRAWKAAVLPILIRERRLVMRNVMRTAFKGIFQPGLIYARQSFLFSKLQSGWTYMRDKIGEGNSAISSKRPQLTRDSSQGADDRRCDVDDHNRYHDRSSCVTLCCIVKSLNERIPSPRSENLEWIAEREGKCDDHHKSKGAVHCNRPDRSSRQHQACVADFLSCEIVSS